MRIIFYLMIALFLFGCNENSQQVYPVDSAVNKSINQLDEIETQGVIEKPRNHFRDFDEQYKYFIFIKGERNSGTNFLFQLLYKNFTFVSQSHSSVDLNSEWKHIPPRENKRKSSKSIDVFIIRKLDGWLLSMFNNPYHINLKNYEFKDFLIAQLESNEVFYKDPLNNLPLNWEDIGKTIFELRYYKLRGLIDYFNNNNNVVFVSLEFLQDDKNAIIFLDALNHAFQLDHAGDYSLITQHTKVNQQIKNRQYDIDISAHRELINAKKDDDIEDFVDHLEFIIKTDDDQIIPIHSKDSVVSEYLPK